MKELYIYNGEKNYILYSQEKGNIFKASQTLTAENSDKNSSIVKCSSKDSNLWMLIQR